MWLLSLTRASSETCSDHPLNHKKISRLQALLSPRTSVKDLYGLDVLINLIEEVSQESLIKLTKGRAESDLFFRQIETVRLSARKE